MKDLNVEISKDLPINIRKLLASIQLPCLKDLPIPILKKKKVHKEALLKDCWSFAKDELKTRKAIDNLKENILISAFEKAIESCYFEMTHWKSRMKKVAGLIIILYNSIWLNKFLSRKI